MIDAVKDYLAPKRFGVVAYVCLIVHFLCGLTFTAVTSALRAGEFGKFSCAVDTKSTAAYKTYVEKTCFAKYEQTYNKPLPLYGFVLLSIGFAVLVSVIYSLAVSRRVEEIDDATSNGSDEPRFEGEESSNGFYVFYLYFFHLVARSLFGILFTVLQYTVFYPGGFDFHFSCSLPRTDASSQINTANNASIGTADVLNSTSIITCENSTASEKRLWGIIVLLLNTIVALIIFVEVIYLSRRFPVFNCRSEVGWSCDTEFVTVYFLRKRFSQPGGLPLTSVDTNTPLICSTPDNRISICGLQDSIDFHKQQILNTPRAPDICYAPNTDFDDLYIDVVINTGRAQHKFSKDMNRHEMYDVYMKVPWDSILLKKIEDLLYPNKDTKGKIPRTILAVGRPGIGKTVLTEKIIRDWANGVDGFYDGKIAFIFKFRWFNIIDQSKNISLKTFLRYGLGLMGEEQFEPIFQDILKNPEKAILIFDGLDEYDGDFMKSLEQLHLFPNDHNTCMSAMNLFIKVVFGKILQGATVLVTSRPTADTFYSKLNFDRSVEVIGFTSDKIEEYVIRFCDNNNRSDLKPKIWNHINSSSDLLNLCYIPVNCFIVCVSLSGCLSDPSNDTGDLPTTLTELYKTAIHHFRQHHDRNLEQTSLVQTVEKLQKLAFDGMENGQLVFNNELFNEQMKKSGLVNSLSNPIFPLKTQFCFTHLTIQEFLAARHVIETLPPGEIEKFISSRIASGKWHLVLQFIAGHLGEKVKMFERDYQDCILAFAKNVTADDGEINIKNQNHLLVIKCLREVDDEDIVKQACDIPALNHITNLDIGRDSYSASDMAALTVVCKHLNNLNYLNCKGIVEENHRVLEISKILQQRCLGTLKLHSYTRPTNDLAKLEVLTNALVNSKCKLKHEHAKLSHLELTIGMTDEGLSMICALFRNGHASRLRVLGLSGNKLTSCGISQIGEVLNDDLCRELTDLDLSDNDIHNDGLDILCNALIQSHCKLKKLILNECSLTAECMRCLCEVICDEPCELNHLAMSQNAIGDEGVDMLCNALIQGHCKLNTLYIYGCSLTAECLGCLCKVLCDEHCELNDLSLSENDIGDEGLRTLCTGALRREQCKLTMLYLDKCSLTAQCVPLLCETLQDRNCKLTRLFLLQNTCSFPAKGTSELSLNHDVEKTESCKARGLKIFFSSNYSLHCTAVIIV